VPIRQGERQLGQIYLTNKIDAPEFSADDEQVIETLAAYAAVAISNARLYKDLRARDSALTRRNENLALLNNLASILASSPAINEILDNALTRVVEYLGVEAGEIFLREEDGRSLYLALQHTNGLGKLWTRDRFLIGQGLVGATAKTGQMQIVTLPGDKRRFLRKALVDAYVRQVACFPMTGRSGVLGVLCVATCNPQPIDDMEIQLLTSIASWVGTAIENVRLNVQGKRLAVLEERERIGMDLHDGIIQSIYAVGLALEHARLLLVDDKSLARSRIEHAIADLNSTIRDIRSYILDLRPRQLHEENLMDGLQRLLNEFRANTSIEATLKGPSEKLDNLPDTQAVALFHICQEALANVAKHSHAKKVDIFIWATAERLLLEMHDDGRGFNLREVTLTIGHGLANMQTRARNVGGDVELTSEPSRGTTILAWVPISNPPVS
jgi:signal transduction histidine kinase